MNNYLDPDEFEDEFTGIFDHLNPEDFDRATTAVLNNAGQRVRGGTNQGKDAFDKFVDLNLTTVRTCYLAARGRINPICVLATPDTQYSFTPEDDETLDDYVARLNREAKRLGAGWVFISRVTLVATGVDPTMDTTDPTLVQQMLDEGKMHQGVVWFAERLEKEVREHRHGLMKAEREDRLGDPLEGPPDQSFDLFSRILG